jgi:hypothetical protein
MGTHSTGFEGDSARVECDAFADKDERLGVGVGGAFVVTAWRDEIMQVGWMETYISRNLGGSLDPCVTERNVRWGRVSGERERLGKAYHVLFLRPSCSQINTSPHQGQPYAPLSLTMISTFLTPSNSFLARSQNMVGVIMFAGSSMSSRARFWAEAYVTPVSQPSSPDEDVLGGRTVTFGTTSFLPVFRSLNLYRPRWAPTAGTG